MKLLVDNWSFFLMFLVFWFGYNEMRAPQYSRGEVAPNFTAITIDGYDLDLEEYKGKYVLLDFWASWCAPCRRDNPQLVEIYHQYEGKKFKDADGFVILSISIDRQPKAWLKAIEEDQLAWRTHVLETGDNQGISDLYSVQQIPTKYLISPNGKIIGTNWTFNKLRRFLKKRKV